MLPLKGFFLVTVPKGWGVGEVRERGRFGILLQLIQSLNVDIGWFSLCSDIITLIKLDKTSSRRNFETLLLFFLESMVRFQFWECWRHFLVFRCLAKDTTFLGFPVLFRFYNLFFFNINEHSPNIVSGFPIIVCYEISNYRNMADMVTFGLQNWMHHYNFENHRKHRLTRCKFAVRSDTLIKVPLFRRKKCQNTRKNPRKCHNHEAFPRYRKKERWEQITTNIQI